MEKRRYRLRPGQKHYIRGEGRETNIFVGGDVIELYPKQALGIKDKIIEVDTGRAPTSEPPPENTAPRPHLQSTGRNRYNVIHPETGEPINEAPLTRAEAEAMLSEQVATGDDNKG